MTILDSPMHVQHLLCNIHVLVELWWDVADVLLDLVHDVRFVHDVQLSVRDDLLQVIGQ